MESRETPIDYVMRSSILPDKKNSHLDDCKCCPATTRGVKGNIRDYLDDYLIKKIEKQHKNKDETIYITDVLPGTTHEKKGYGGGLSLAIRITELVKRGYKVNVSLVGGRPFDY